jgi:DNA recombination-dependent growth factor C
MSYNVGQILYILVKKQQTVIPAQVVEQILRRTLAGEETMYSVNVPTKGGQLTQLSLDEVAGEVFTTLDDAHAKMLENASAAIDSLTSAALKTANKYFPVENETPFQDIVNHEDEGGKQTVEALMDDGTVVKVHMPTNI